MKGELKGKVLLRAETWAYAVKIKELQEMLGTDSGKETARLVPFFGPCVMGESAFVNALGLNLDRALLGGHAIEFERPFVADEPLHVEMRLADYSEKNGMQFGTIETLFTTPAGEQIQLQTTTFIERMAA